MTISITDLPPPPEGRVGWPWTEGTGIQLSEAERAECFDAIDSDYGLFLKYALVWTRKALLRLLGKGSPPTGGKA